MKTLIGAIALLLAAPAVAQSSAPAADPHAGHAQHQQGQHHQGEHGQRGEHAGHMACCKDGQHKECCEKAKAEGRKMACCEGKPAAAADHSGHSQH